MLNIIQGLSTLWGRLRPAQLFVGSFVVLVLVGMLGFMVLPGLYTGEGLSWLDALFTATSAVCVTGLIVVDTATYFTPLGQVWILLLIQLGGLGIITLGSLIITALNQRLPLRTHALATGIEVLGTYITPRELIRRIFVFTFAIEIAGALFLWIWWGLEGNWEISFWPALFHSISAFCNAGFSTWSDSLMQFQKDPVSLGIISLLIILGGIGFVVMSDLGQWWNRRSERPGHRLSLHSKITLLTTLILIVVGWVLFTVFEWEVTFASLGPVDRIVNGFFMSITSRTAGFNAIDYGAASDSSNFLTILLMSVGGSPGSTAGGLKTTTIAVIIIVAWSRLRGMKSASILGRSLPEDTVQQAIGFFTLGFVLITAGIFAFTTLELPYVSHRVTERGFLPYMFETVSAFNTVGLSMGATSLLGAQGKVITIILMFIGRVGPLTLAAAVAARSHRSISKIKYATEDVMIG
ncbi:MAG: TrkH family potassium uptake protein [Candidatus Kapaibacterium sp.]